MVVVGEVLPEDARPVGGLEGEHLAQRNNREVEIPSYCPLCSTSLYFLTVLTLPLH